MTSQTKHYLIIGGALVVAVVIGIVLYKRYAVSASASQATQDQSNQDALAFLEANAMNSPYGGGGVATGGVSFPSAAPQQSLADEIASIEQAFGFAAPASTSTGASTPSAGSSSSPSVSPSPVAPRTVSPVPPRRAALLNDEPATLKMEHEEFVS